MSEQFPGQPPDQDPRSRLEGQSLVGLPSQSIGTPRPPRQFRKALGNAFPYVLGLALAIAWILVPSARPLFIVIYAMYLIVASVTALVRRGIVVWRRRRSR
jgi:hypothetical protein